MSSLSKIIINTSFGRSNILVSMKLANFKTPFNLDKTKWQGKNFSTLPSLRNEIFKNKSFNNKIKNNNDNNKNNIFPTIFYNIHQCKTYSTTYNNPFFNDSIQNSSYSNIKRNLKPTINNVIKNLTTKISFSHVENVIGTNKKWSGNVKNGFILLDEDNLNLQQLGNLFRGFFIYNGNSKQNRKDNSYYYNKNLKNSRRYNTGNRTNNKKRKRIKFKKLNNRNVFYTLLGINLLVFAAWQYAIEQAQRYNNYKYYRFMEDNFCVSWDKVVKRKHWWTLLTSAFSHQEKMHFIMNMLVFNSFASPVIRALGPENFLALYLFTGLCSSLSHITFNHFLLPKINKNYNEESVFDFFFPQHHKAVYDNISSLGASGAIMGINTLFACLYPNSIIQYGMFLPLPAWLGMSIYTILDIYRTATMTNGRIDTAGHVGGALSGLLFYIVKIRPYIQNWKNFY